MGLVGAVLSFVCAGLLSVYVPVKRVYSSVPHLSLILWFIGYNVVQGVNGLLWDGNVDIHATIWCDITTRFTIAAKVGIAGALTCLARDLELFASKRSIATNPIVVRNRLILDFFLCLIFPLVCLLFHLFVQDHRFDLVKDLGCIPSVHRSVNGSLAIFVPVMFFCCLAFALCVACFHHVSSRRLAEHLKDRCSFNSGSFRRHLSIVASMCVLMILFNIYAWFTFPVMLPGAPWSVVHASMDMVEVIDGPDSWLERARAEYFGFSIVSGVLVLMMMSLGEETRDIARYIKNEATRERRMPKWNFTLPTFQFRSREPGLPHFRAPSSFNKKSKAELVPAVVVDLKSGWDDMLDEKKSKSPSPSSRSRSPFSPPSPTFSRNSTAKHEDDEAFLESTISYLGSPPAKTLGLAIPVRPPPPALSSPERTRGAVDEQKMYHAPRRATSTRKPVPKDVPSAISDVLDSPWPLPPSSPTPTGGSTRHSPGHSPTSSAGETAMASHIYPSAMSPTSDVSSPSLYSTSTHQYGERPFEGSGIAMAAPVPAHRVVIKRTSLRSLHRSLSSDLSSRFCPSPSPSGHRDVIHMTVVREMA